MRERGILFQAPMVRALLAGTKTQTRRVAKFVPLDPGLNFAFTGLRAAQDRPGLWTLQSRDGATNLNDRTKPLACPYGQPGDRLWVREAFMHESADYCWEASVSIPSRPASTVYRADFPESQPGEGWRPSIHMPRKLSRITLEITGVRVERLQEISESDAYAEGISDDQVQTLLGMVEAMNQREPQPARACYRELWESINGSRRDPSHIRRRRVKGKPTERYDAAHLTQTPAPYSWDANPWVWVVEFRRVQP